MLFNYLVVAQCKTKAKCNHWAMSVHPLTMFRSESKVAFWILIMLSIIREVKGMLNKSKLPFDSYGRQQTPYHSISCSFFFYVYLFHVCLFIRNWKLDVGCLVSCYIVSFGCIDEYNCGVFIVSYRLERHYCCYKLIILLIKTFWLIRWLKHYRIAPLLFVIQCSRHIF